MDSGAAMTPPSCDERPLTWSPSRKQLPMRFVPPTLLVPRGDSAFPDAGSTSRPVPSCLHRVPRIPVDSSRKVTPPDCSKKVQLRSVWM